MVACNPRATVCSWKTLNIAVKLGQSRSAQVYNKSILAQHYIPTALISFSFILIPTIITSITIW